MSQYVERNIRSLSTSELLAVLNEKAGDYTEEAKHIAHNEIAERDGEQKLRKSIEAANAQVRDPSADELYDHIIMTTETACTDLKIKERLSIVTSEVAIGLNIFKDLMTVARDIVGGRSATIQKAFADARRSIVTEMRHEAHLLGADAIVGVDFKYSEISSGRSMLLIGRDWNGCDAAD